MREMTVDISGPGFILYSPSAVTHIPEGSDYLDAHFWQPDDVARHVMDCQMTTFCTHAKPQLRWDGVPNLCD